MKNHESEFATVSRQAALANLGIGAANTIAAIFTGSSAQVADGVHNVLDSIAHLLHRSTHTSQVEHAEHHVTSRTKVFQAMAGVAIAAGGVLTGYHAVESLANPEADVAYTALAMELGAVGVNAFFLHKSVQTSGDTNGRRHGIWHNATDTVLSSITVAGIAFNEVTAGYSDGAAGLLISIGSLALGYKVATDSHESHHSTL